MTRALTGYIRHIFSYHELIANLVVKDLKVRYKTAVLGFLWAVLNPLFMMLILSVVFSLIVKIEIDKFPVFLLTALVPWYFFSASLLAATTSIVDNANLVKKIYFPREIIPLAVVTSSLINLLLSIGVLFVVMMVFGVAFSPVILFLPVAVGILFVFVLGVALFCAALHVFFRDVKYIIDILLMAGFYWTPIFYPVELVPETIRSAYVAINPMASLILIFRDILFYGTFPAPSMIVYAGVISLASLGLGLWFFRRSERILADYV